MEQLRNYIYMDMAGIDSLLFQITSESVETSSIQTTNRKTSGTNGSIGFSELVKKLFNADVSVSGEIESTQTISKTTTQPYEAKIPNYYQEDKQNFVLFTMSFYTDFYHNDWFKTVALAKQYGYIQFYKGGDNTNKFKDTYQYDDTYYKTMALDKVKLTMNLSIEKMEPFGGITSHLATLLRVTHGPNIRLGVFGHIYRLTESVYQIKPYAVWRA